MQIYTIFFPSGLPQLAAAEKAVAVRQGFDWNASLITPIWAVQYDLWLALALWTGVTVAFIAVVAVTHLDATSAVGAYTLISTAFGCEADRLRELKLTRSGYALQGLSFGDNAEDAEDLYIQRHVQAPPQDEAQDEAKASHIAADSPIDPPPPGASDLLGLFSARER